MHSESITDKILSDQFENGWAIFRYDLKYALTKLLFRLFFLVLTLGMTMVFSIEALKNHQTTQLVFAMVSGCLTAIVLLSTILVLKELLTSKKSIIVITHDRIVKHHHHRFEEFLFEDIHQLNATNMYSDSTPSFARRGQQFIDFKDKQSGKQIQLTKNRQFGNPEPLFSLLKSRVKTETSNTVHFQFHQS
jgi:hypothetical protein